MRNFTEHEKGFNQMKLFLPTEERVHVTPSSELEGRYSLEDNLMNEGQSDDLSLGDESKALAMQVVWLCSWAYEDVSCLWDQCGFPLFEASWQDCVCDE